MLGARQWTEAYADETGAFYTNQFETRHNPAAYRNTLAVELIEALPDLDYFVAGAGSGGTFAGVAEELQSHDVKSIVVEPAGSILSGQEKGRHDTEGIGVEVWPHFLNEEWIEAVEVVSDAIAFQHVKDLARYEGILAGSSSGAALEGAIRAAARLDHGKVVTIFPDSSDRYMSKKIFQYGGDLNE
ncbi:cystathionine beta-synthase [Staphylococcus intermedius NCTC 11048]|uniref:Cystathionine beta-synthase n=2 Tax=Staphylococcus intermedius TaxID=1285 RepID=A0A380G2Q0_STAIN|nr:cystathionine beta-synthase [Staphylococcus intermedius NCTC 11048]